MSCQLSSVLPELAARENTSFAAKAGLQHFCAHLLVSLQQVAPIPSCLEANHVT